MNTAELLEIEACGIASHTSYSTWYIILCSVSFWCICYLMIQKTFRQKSPEWCSRVVTLIHGSGSAITGLSECVSSNLFEIWNIPQTENQQTILLVSLGYFTFDLMWCLYYQTESKIMLVHHVLSMIGLYRLLHKNYAGPQTCCAVGGLEVTNPLLQIRWFIRSSESNKNWFVLADIIFAVCFLIMRCGFGTYFFLNILFFQECYEFEYKMYTTVLYVISWLFVLNILQYLFYKYRKNSDISKITVATFAENSTISKAAISGVTSVVSTFVNSDANTTVNSAMNINTAEIPGVNTVAIPDVNATVITSVNTSVIGDVTTAVNSDMNTTVISNVNTADNSSVTTTDNSEMDTVESLGVDTTESSGVDTAASSDVNSVINSVMNTTINSGINTAVNSSLNPAITN